MWKDFYQSYWQHPGVLVVLPLLVLFFIRPMQGWLRGYLIFFTLETILDALLTGPFLRELGLTASPVASIISIFFVVLGDFRVFLLAFYLWGKRGLKRLYLAALVLALIVPCMQAWAIETFPVYFGESHAIYLAYELLCLSLLLGLAVYKKTRWLFLFSALYYSFWSLADICILTGFDFGYAIRLLPNLLYYGLTTVFIAFWLSPQRKALKSMCGGTLRVGFFCCGVFFLSCRSNDCPAALEETPLAKLLVKAGPSDTATAGDINAALVVLNGSNAGKQLTLKSALQKLEFTEITSFDPHYQKKKSFRAFPLAALIRLAFGMSEDDVLAGDIQMIASDGYQVSLDASLAEHPDAFLAFADSEFSQWEPVGAKKVSPGPFYLVWRGDGYQDLNEFPRPWAVVKLGYQPGGKSMPQLLPPLGLHSEAAKHGHALFLAECVHCHAINGQGGKVGPELNIPMNILSYRTEEQVRRFIQSPQQFRPSVMPPHPNFQERDYQGILAYFRAMSDYQVVKAID